MPRLHLINSKLAWWHWVVGINIFLLIITILGGSEIQFPANWRLVHVFSLAKEMNFAAWWSGILLFAIGFILYEFFHNRKDGTQLAFLLLSLLFFGLSLDEIGSIHERIIYGYASMIPYAAVALGMWGYSFFIMVKNAETRPAAFLIFWGIVLYGSVVLQEIIEHSVNWPLWFMGIRNGIEEGTELLATFLVLCGILPLRQHYRSNSSLSLIPDSSCVKWLQVLFLVGLILHLFLVAWVIPNFIEIWIRGNPGAWYPVVVFFLLFSRLFLDIFEKGSTKSIAFKLLAGFFLLLSIGSMSNLTFLVFRVPEPEHLNELWSFWYFGCLLLMVFAIPRKLASIQNRENWIFGTLTLLGIVGFLSASNEISYIMLGILAYGSSMIFLNHGLKEKMI